MEFLSLLELLLKQGCSPKGHDEWEWGLGNNRDFYVESFYEKQPCSRGPADC